MSSVLRPGLAALAKRLWLGLAPSIRANSLTPGRVDTDRIRFLDGNFASVAGIDVSEQRRRLESAIALGRYGEPGESGRVAAFVLSPAASYVTGAAIQVDGCCVAAMP